MQYMLLIYDDEKAATAEVEEAEMAEYFALNEALQEKKRLIAGDALQPTSTATSVRVRDGKVMTTDGPFAETKEQLGGYYLIEADDLDEALAWAQKIPAVRHGTVEVRPVLDLSQLEQ